MSTSLYHTHVPGFIAMLRNIQAWLDKAATTLDETALMEARLAPDMLPLPRQIQIASDAAKGAAARLTGSEPPAMPDTETTLAELKERCAKTIAYLESADPAAFDAGAAREVVITFPNGAGIRFDGLTFLAGFATPNFYFHATTAYDILRQKGVPLGKRDFLGKMRIAS